MRKGSDLSKVRIKKKAGVKSRLLCAFLCMQGAECLPEYSDSQLMPGPT
jgi:hypothetical protein